jgi:hypothetical protein
VILAVTAVSIAGLHLRPHPKLCLLEPQNPAAAEQKEDACHFTFVACGLTVPITAGVVTLEVNMCYLQLVNIVIIEDNDQHYHHQQHQEEAEEEQCIDSL